MHRAWYIDELVRTVVRECDGQGASALSQTCRHLFDIAADELWRNLPALEYLSLVLPNPSVASEDLGQLIASMQRFALYSARVHSIVISQPHGDEPSVYLMSYILRRSHYTFTDLFPNLHAIVIHASNTAFLERIINFSLPNAQLERVSLQIVPCGVEGSGLDTSHLTSAASMQLEEMLATSGLDQPDCLDLWGEHLQRLPRLDSLCILKDNEDDDDHVNNLLDIVARDFQNTVASFALTTVDLPVQAFSLLHTFSNLDKLRICLRGNVIVSPEECTFPHLREVHLELHVYTLGQELLDRLSAPRLKIVEITASHKADDPSRHFQDCMRIIARKWPELKHFALKGLVLDKEPWSFEPFRPLLACKSLQQLDIAFHRLFVSDDEVQDIANSLPDLRTLQLTSDPNFFAVNPLQSCAPRATFQSLYTLATLLPELNMLSLHIALDPTTVSLPATFASHCRLRHLLVPDCPPCPYPYEAARLLRLLFPKVGHFGSPGMLPNFADAADPDALLQQEKERVATLGAIATMLGFRPSVRVEQDDDMSDRSDLSVD